MASVTLVSSLETSPTQLDQAIHWANKIRDQLLLVAPYDDSEDEFLPSSVVIDESIMEAPRRRAAAPEVGALASQIAQLLYPSPDNSLGSLIKYEKDIVKLRQLVLKQRERVMADVAKRKELFDWTKRIAKQGAWDPATDPWSLDGAPSLPMPVKIAESDSLEPFFEHLALDGTEDKLSSARAIKEAIEMEEPYYNTKSLEFEKGVVYSDHRMDLCKMALGPTHIGELIESLKTNTFVTHFLLGNNIIGPYGAECIAKFLKEFPNRMDTWYLAGNCIDTVSFKLLVDEWVQSTSVTNIWLKRNPLMSTAAHDVFRLITQTPNLRTLDLDQTELGDAAVAEIFSKLARHEPDKPLALRHIYLNAVGIGVKGATAIGKYLASPHCTLDAIYANNNPLGNEGATILASRLKKNESLSRLTLASVGLGDEGAIALCEALYDHPNIAAFDLGQHFATQDLGSRYNWITDRSAQAIYDLIASSPRLSYLNLSFCPMTNTGLNMILSMVTSSRMLVFYDAKTTWPQEKAAAAVVAGQAHAHLLKQARDALATNVKRIYGDSMSYEDFLAEEKRWLINDKTDVRKIDSVYRNRDARMARRRLMKLDKWWNEDDETLAEVMKGAVGPLCTRRAKVKDAAGPVCTKRMAKV